jgi:hypothetical protein
MNFISSTRTQSTETLGCWWLEDPFTWAQELSLSPQTLPLRAARMMIVSQSPRNPAARKVHLHYPLELGTGARQRDSPHLQRPVHMLTNQEARLLTILTDLSLWLARWQRIRLGMKCFSRIELQERARFIRRFGRQPVLSPHHSCRSSICGAPERRIIATPSSRSYFGEVRSKCLASAAAEGCGCLASPLGRR